MSGNAFAETPKVPIDKSGYSLFRRVPRESLRELSSDRPDKTESPFTVDPGWFQIEADLISYTQDRTDGVGGKTFQSSWGTSLNLKAGLTEQTDIQVVILPQTTELNRVGTGPESRAHGFGDTTLRFKWNLIGNDEETFALTLLPFYVFPTASEGFGSNAPAGGLAVPLEVKLPRGFRLGTMIEVVRAKEEAEDPYATKFIASATFGHSLVDAVDGYVEIYSERSHRDGGAPPVVTLDFGIEVQANDDLQFDAGMNVGMSDAADDLNPFAGVTYRF